MSTNAEKKFLAEAEKYRMTCDLHTHTVYSHGKETIESNVKVAVNKGLEAIAISDHGPGHLTYGMKLSDVKEMREEINRLSKLYPQIKIYLSVEANIKEKAPFIDVSAKDADLFDFIIAGYHYGVRKANIIANWLDAKGLVIPPISRKLLETNTDMTVKSIYENDIKILTHPGDKGRFDLKEIAKACAARGTFVELNIKHPVLDADAIKLMAKEDVKFIISSDAHLPGNIGIYKPALVRAFQAGLDPERIVNIERIDGK